MVKVPAHNARKLGKLGFPIVAYRRSVRLTSGKPQSTHICHGYRLTPYNPTGISIPPRRQTFLCITKCLPENTKKSRLCHCRSATLGPIDVSSRTVDARQSRSPPDAKSRNGKGYSPSVEMISFNSSEPSQNAEEG